MITYNSVVNGMKILMGNFVIQIALGFVLLFYGRPPVFDDNEAKTDAAQKIFTMLAIGRPIFAVVMFLDVYGIKGSTILVVFCIFFQVYIYVMINMNFLFAQGDLVYPINQMNEEQKSFTMLLWLQVESMKSYIIFTVLYILVSRVKRPEIVIDDKNHMPKSQ